MFPYPISFLSSTGSAFSNTKSTLFDGIDDYMDCGNITTLNGVTQASWSFWFKIENTNTVYILGQWGSGTDRQIYVLLIPPSNRIDVGLAANVGFRSTTTTLAIDTWYNMVITYNGGNAPSSTRCKLYINEVEQTNGGFTGPTSLYSPTSNFTIGKRNDLGWGEITGNFDEFAIFDTELNQTEVTEIYNSGTPNDLATHSKSDDLKHWWRMGDKVVSFPTIPDQAGSNNGTAYNEDEATMIVDDVP